MVPVTIDVPASSGTSDSHRAAVQGAVLTGQPPVSSRVSSSTREQPSGQGWQTSGAGKVASRPVLILASQSPRRRQLLQQLGFEPICLASDIDETPQTFETPHALVRRLAKTKAGACARRTDLDERTGSTHQSRIILAADTVIDLEGQVLGKPQDETEAISMLRALSDREHQVHTGVCVLQPDTEVLHCTVVSTDVRFSKISVDTARKYWNSGEPAGKAGGYAIQGIGARFVVHLSGSYSNVVGLPLFETAGLLECVGLTSL